MINEILPGIEPDGVVANKPTFFEIFTAGAGKGRPDVVVLDPNGRKDTVPAKVTPGDNDTYRHSLEYRNQLRLSTGLESRSSVISACLTI